MPKDKAPVTPVPIPDELRTQLYASAEKQGRKLAAHIVFILKEAMAKEARK